MFFWLDFSSWWSSIISVAGLCLAGLVAWLALYIVYRLITDNVHIQRPAQRGTAAPAAGQSANPEPRGFIGRMTVKLGTGLGLLLSKDPNANNRRSKAFLVFLTLATLAFMFGYLPYAYRHAQPNGLRDAVLAETFGQQPLSGTSMTRSAYLPNPDEFYGTLPAKSSSTPVVTTTDTGSTPVTPKSEVQPIANTTVDRPATSLLWLFFWVFAFLPLLWACAILYAVLSLREETWGGVQKMVSKLRDWIGNMNEFGIRGPQKAGGAQGGFSFSTPVIMTTSGATAAEAEKPKAEVPWAKIMQWMKRNSGEIVAGLFVIDEILELGAVRSKHRN